jgi:hypothetical protein
MMAGRLDLTGRNRLSPLVRLHYLINQPLHPSGGEEPPAPPAVAQVQDRSFEHGHRVGGLPCGWRRTAAVVG